jgi:membrane protease YdiL (CAAX protease family)
MYIEQAYKGLTDAWRYVVSGIIIAIAWQVVGMLPLVTAIGINTKSISKIPNTIPSMIAALGNNLFLFLMLLSFAIGLLAIFLCTKFIHQLSFKNLTTTRAQIDWKRFGFMFALWGLISSSFVLIDYYVIAPENYVWNFKLAPFLILCAISFLMLPLQTSFEEYAFRGYGMQFLGVVFQNRWLPLLVTSVGFGVLHIFNPEVQKLGYSIMIYYIGTGLFLGIITLMDEGLELALGFHCANNIFTALLVTADWTALQTHSILKDISDPEVFGLREIFIPVCIVFPILLFILSKKYNWTNWKEKLLGNVTVPKTNSYNILED